MHIKNLEMLEIERQRQKDVQGPIIEKRNQKMRNFLVESTKRVFDF